MTTSAMSRTTLVAAVTLYLFALVTLPAASLAQQPPAEHFPTRFLHGWSVTDFATSRNQLNPHHYYVIDGSHAIAVISSRDGRILPNISYFDPSHFLSAIAVDGRNNVFVTSYSSADGYQVRVFDESLYSLKNVSLSGLRPPLVKSEYNQLQLAVDSTNWLYVFNSSPQSSTDGQVWVLSPRLWQQVSSWRAPIPTPSNRTDSANFVLAIDSDDYLYFQQVGADKTLYITNQKGLLQAHYQLGTGNASDPWIDSVAIDAQLQMWHTHQDSTYVSVIDSSGKLVAGYDVLSSASYGWSAKIDTDRLGNVVVSDREEQALLTVSQRGDVISTLQSPVPSLWAVTELLADYGGGGGGRGGGSLLFGDWSSTYLAKRISVSDLHTGELLQRYSLPPRLSEQCSVWGLDVGVLSSNIYAVLACFDPMDFSFYSLVYVMTQAGLVVSDFRVHDNADRIRADEYGGVLYITDNYRSDPRGSAIIAYSAVDGRQLANYTTTNPPLSYIADITLLPPAGPQTGPTLVAVDITNHRFVHFDLTGNTVPVAIPFLNDTMCEDITFSLSKHSSVFYVSCTLFSVVNGSFTESTFIHKWDVTTPGQPLLTDSYVPPAGAEANFGAIVIGLDQHLYAYDYTSGSVWQWREADRVSSASQPQLADEQPRVHVGQT